MPRPRLTIRRMMLLVAGIAVVIGVPLERRARFLRLSASHSSLAWRGSVPRLDAAGREIGKSFVEVPHPSWCRHFYLANKYASAAQRPWLPAEPDPPETIYTPGL